MSKSKNSSSKIYSVYIILSLVFSVLCYIIGAENFSDKPLYLLPLSYGLTLAICRGLRKTFLSLSIIIINTVCLIRYSLYPLTLVLEGYTYFTTESMYLMVYEVIAVLLFLNIYSKRLHSTYDLGFQIKNKRIGPINMALIPITFMLGLMFPSLLSVFAYFGGGSADLSGAISILFSVGLMVIYVSILTKLSELKGLKGTSLLIASFVAIIYIFLTSFGESNVHRWKFLSVGIPTIFILTASFPKYRKQIVIVSSIAIIFSIFLGSFIKFAVSDISVNSFLSNFLTSDSLGEYFGGLNGITNSLSLLRGDHFAGSFESTLTDFFGNMPVVSRYFNTDLYSTEALYLDALGRTDLICPLLSQSVLHFGVLGAPVMSIIMAIIAIESDRYSKLTRSMYSMFGALTMCVIFSLFMCLNTTILMPNAWKFLIYLIIQYINDKIYFNGKTIYNSTSL